MHFYKALIFLNTVLPHSPTHAILYLTQITVLPRIDQNYM